MKFDLDTLPPAEQYKLLSATIVPRPIALISTRAADGTDNAAPFSFFGVLGEDPALLVVGIKDYPDGRKKDTAANIEATGEFVVNLVDEAIVEAMNVCATDYPPHISEIEQAGLSLAASEVISVPRIAEAPVSFECRLFSKVDGIPERSVLIGRVVQMHVRDEIYDAGKKRIVLDHYRPVGRMTGSLYIRASDTFSLERRYLDKTS